MENAARFQELNAMFTKSTEPKKIKVTSYVRQAFIKPLVFRECVFTSPTFLKGRQRKVSMLIDDMTIAEYTTPLLREGKRLSLRITKDTLSLFELHKGEETCLFEREWDQDKVSECLDAIETEYRKYFYTREEVKIALGHRPAYKRLVMLFYKMDQVRKRSVRNTRPQLRHFYETDKGIVLYFGTGNTTYEVHVGELGMCHNLVRLSYDLRTCVYNKRSDEKDAYRDDRTQLDFICTDYHKNATRFYNTAESKFYHEPMPSIDMERYELV